MILILVFQKTVEHLKRNRKTYHFHCQDNLCCYQKYMNQLKKKKIVKYKVAILQDHLNHLIKDNPIEILLCIVEIMRGLCWEEDLQMNKNF